MFPGWCARCAQHTSGNVCCAHRHRERPLRLLVCSAHAGRAPAFLPRDLVSTTGACLWGDVGRADPVDPVDPDLPPADGGLLNTLCRWCIRLVLCSSPHEHHPCHQDDHHLSSWWTRCCHLLDATLMYTRVRSESEHCSSKTYPNVGCGCALLPTRSATGLPLQGLGVFKFEHPQGSSRHCARVPADNASMCASQEKMYSTVRALFFPSCARERSCAVPTSCLECWRCFVHSTAAPKLWNKRRTT